jgi:hypothetical protein
VRRDMLYMVKQVTFEAKVKDKSGGFIDLRSIYSSKIPKEWIGKRVKIIMKVKPKRKETSKN